MASCIAQLRLSPLVALAELIISAAASVASAGAQAWGQADERIEGDPRAGICGCRGSAGCGDQKQEAQAELAPAHASGALTIYSLTLLQRIHCAMYHEASVSI